MCLPWVPCDLGQGALALSVKGVIVACPRFSMGCSSILVSTVIRTPYPLPTCLIAPFQLSYSLRGLHTSLDQWGKGLSRATQPQDALL